MTEIDALVERLRYAHACADRQSPGPFSFVHQVSSMSGDCVAVVVVSRDNADARIAAAKAVAG
jgi:hypothetical protein